MIVAGSIDWTYIIGTLILTLPAIIAAVYAGRVHRKIKTPSGTSIGKQIENIVHTALANNYRLQALNGEVAPPGADAIQAEAERAHAATVIGVPHATVPPESV